MKFKNLNIFQDLTKKKNLFLIFIILSCGLIFFNKFSITGDIQSRLGCITSLNIPAESCSEQIYYHFNLHIFILFFVKIAEIISFLIPSLSDANDKVQRIYFEAFLSLIFYLFFILNIILLIFYSAKKNKNFRINFSIPIIFLFTSYIGNFVNFDHFEIILANLFSLKLIINKQNKSTNFVFNLIIDFIIITSKIYYLPVVIILNILIFKKNLKNFFLYNFFISFISLIIFFYKSYLITKEGNYNFNSWYKPNYEILSTIENFFSIFFSPSIGLFITAPLILLSIFYSIKKFDTKIKFLSLLSLIVILSFFYFWHGNGSSGSRYLYPILILFYEEFEIFFVRFCNSRYFRILVFLIFISFFQSLNYHSPVLLFSYTDSKIYNDYKILSKKYINVVSKENRFPKYDYKYSPQYFGWNLEIKKITNQKNIYFDIKKNKKLIDTDKIIPNTLISRLYYISRDINEYNNNSRIAKYNINNIFSKLSINIFIYVFINLLYFYLFYKIIFFVKKY